MDSKTKDYPADITTFLNEDHAFSQTKQQRLMRLVYRDLKRIAINRLKNEWSRPDLTVTALVHESFLSLNQGNHSRVPWNNRRHFYGFGIKITVFVQQFRNKKCLNTA